ncbi:MAG: S1C family serine protease [Clostridiales Family XIII bacterium]|jgi:S1-C subfamily serine protease|nr:S1C family serine protease [Clostridiales Family XIII bacterium]
MEERKYFRKSTVVVLLIIAVLLSATAGFGGAYWALQVTSGRNDTSEQIRSTSYTINTTSEDMTVTEAVAKKVLDSVVGITATYQEQGGYYGSMESSSVGSGIIVDEEGYILTNSHVVNDGSASALKVLLADGREVEGKLLWNDASIDLAIVKIEADGLMPAELGNSDKIPIGSYAAAIGNPLGLNFNGSITSGVVSGLNRSLDVGSALKTVRMEGLIQVDAAINSGNSGGPLLNSKGEVIGVNTAKATAEGMGFAIPINTAKPIIDHVIKTGSFERSYMGVSASSAKDLASQYPSLGLDDVEGAYLTTVAPGSPAEKAGLKAKDIITAVDDKKITNSTDLIKALLSYSPGDKVTITYLREGTKQKCEVELLSQDEIYSTGAR